MFKFKKLRWIAVGIALLAWTLFPCRGVAALNVTARAALLMEARTGEILYEKDADVRLSPASVTKIMTLLIALEQVDNGRISLTDTVIVSEHASSMGGSQVFLAEGEQQTLDTMLKCIAVSSGNDASVAVAEHIAGSEEAFVEWMNSRAAELGMQNTHFVDCCGLTDSDQHYTTARDVAIMSRELITKHPEIFDYTKIWMEDITHVTRQGSSTFGLSSTNKLLKQYEWTTGLKTGSTSKAGYCMSATAQKDGMDMIAVILGADASKVRFREARELLTYGFANCKMYTDANEEAPEPVKVAGGKANQASIGYENPFYYLEKQGRDLSAVKKQIQCPTKIQAPMEAGEVIGFVSYTLGEEELGRVNICLSEEVPAAGYGDCILKTLLFWLL